MVSGRFRPPRDDCQEVMIGCPELMKWSLGGIEGLEKGRPHRWGSDRAWHQHPCSHRNLADKYPQRQVLYKGVTLFGVQTDQRAPSRRRGHGGGVAIIHKDGLSAQTVTTAGAGYTTFEYCDVQFNNSSGLLNIILVYRLPATKRKDHTIKAFPEVGPGHLVILRDLNVHVDNAADSNAKKFLDLLDLLNFSQHVTSITHKAGHTLNLVITHDSEAVIENVTVSDNALVLVHAKHPKPLPTQITTSTHKLRGLDATSLAAEVSTLAQRLFTQMPRRTALLRSTIPFSSRTRQVGALLY